MTIGKISVDAQDLRDLTHDHTLHCTGDTGGKSLASRSHTITWSDISIFEKKTTAHLHSVSGSIASLRHPSTILVFWVKCRGRESFEKISKSNAIGRKKARPLPTLLVNFVTLSEKPNTVFFTKLAAPYTTIRLLGKKTGTSSYFRNSYTKLLVAVHHSTIERFIKDICHSGTDVCEETYWISNEISGA
jgi:hypothetical protein